MTVSFRWKENVDSQSSCNDLLAPHFKRLEIFRYLLFEA
jgi:hypothetical protein